MPTISNINVKDAIESRRSIRVYTNESVPETDLREILHLASLAPSAWNLQPWRLVVVTNRELIRGPLKEAGFNQKQYDTAPVAIAFTADGEGMLADAALVARPGSDPEKLVGGVQKAFGGKTVTERGQYAQTQANIALGFLAVAARGLGYDTSVMAGFNADKVREVLGLPDHTVVSAMVTLGKRAEEGLEHHRLPLEHTVRFVR